MRFLKRKNAADGVRHSGLMLVTGLCMLIALPVAAERADRNKPVHLEADHATLDDINHVVTFEGNAVLTQGTLVIRGDRMVVKQDAAGFQFGTAYGNPAYFRQKREGLDEYIEGFGERIEYDNKTNQTQLFERARLKKSSGDEVRGDHISYDQTTEFYRVVGGGQSTATNGADGRVHAVIQPKSNNKPEKPLPLLLKPATQVTPPDDSSASPAP